jgi:hypothetical protein
MTGLPSAAPSLRRRSARRRWASSVTRITLKTLTADVAYVLRVEIAAGTAIPNPADSSEQEVHPME